QVSTAPPRPATETPAQTFASMPLPPTPPSAPTPPEPVEPPPVVEPKVRPFTDDELIQAAYDKGRRHGALAMELPSHRVAIARDWWIAIGLALLATAAGFIAFPLLPFALGAWTAWTVVRRRTSMAAYRGGRST